MPLITITGHPCCGKTSFATTLVDYLKNSGISCVVLVNEEMLHLDKTTGYNDTLHEKILRQSLKSAVDRNLNSDTYVILDSLNYIKGFRYELYCIARSQRTPHCVVWVECEEETSNKWNEQSLNYDMATLIELRRRFEAPDDKNRWDQPLFRVNMTPTSADKISLPSCNNVVSLESTSTINLNMSDKNDTTTIVVGDAGAEAVKSDLVSSEVLSQPPKKSSWKKSNKSTTSNNTSTGAKVPTPLVQTFHKLTLDNLVRGGEGVEEDCDASSSVFSFQQSQAGGGVIVPQSTINFSDRNAAPRDVYFSGTSATKSEYLGVSPESACVDIFKFFDKASTPVGTLATKPVRHADADLLYILDTTSQLIVQAVMNHQQIHSDGTPVIMKEYGKSVPLNRRVTLLELQRHRRQFVKMNGQHPPNSSIDAGSKFIDFLNNQLA